MQFLIAFNILFKRIKAIRFLLMDKTVHLWKKALIVGGLIYLVLPFDLIPPVLFPIAWMDDLVLWIWILWVLRKTLDKYWMGETEDYSKKYKSKEVLDDVEYEVKEESNVKSNDEPNKQGVKNE
jgi:uncharacterized membrane protein YkvA (DUF1232 family)